MHSETGVKRNILVVHLESLSRSNIWQYRNELRTVWRLFSTSLQFDRFFCNSTSTTMSMTDFRFGDSSVHDCCPSYDLSKKLPYGTRCFKALPREIFDRDQSYAALTFHSSPYSPGVEKSDDFGSYINCPDGLLLSKKALSLMAKTKKGGRPFYAYFWDDASHLAFRCARKNNAPTVAERLRAAFSIIDNSLASLLSGMSELGLLENTIIVGFGDHGDEPWSHGLNRGYSHALPPYASQTWTPMFIHVPDRLESGRTSQLASMVDLKKTILHLLFPAPEYSSRRTPFEGIDLLGEKRTVAFSQNMFALQRERSDPERGMVKGYAVTDGEYRLVVASGGDWEKAMGMSLYYDQSDPSNSFNLLKFFRLDRRSGEIRKFSPPPEAVARHFVHVFGASQVESLKDTYHRLRQALREYVAMKERLAFDDFQQIVNSPEDAWNSPYKNAFTESAPQTFPMEAFDRIAQAPD